MSSSLAFRHLRRLSTAAATAPTTTTPSSISISQVKTKLKSEFDPDEALKIYASFSDHYNSPTSSRYAQDLTVRRLAKSHRFADIEKLIESHKSDPKITQEQFLSTLIRSYGLAGMFDHALKTYNQMDQFPTPRSAVSFNALLSACNQSKLFHQVPLLFDEMPLKHRFSPNKVSYGILVKSYCELGKTELAIDRLKEMEEKGVEITTITCTTILHSLYKKGDIDEAEKIWNKMVAPDVGAYNVKLMHAQGGEVGDVKKLIDEMIGLGLKPDAISYNYLMSCYCRNGMMEEAKKVYDGLEGNKCKPNAATFRTLIYYLCRNEQFETGYKVFKESVKLSKIPDFNTLKHLVEGLAKTSNRKDARGLIRTVKKKFPPNLLVAMKKLEDDLGLASLSPEEVADEKRETSVSVG